MRTKNVESQDTALRYVVMLTLMPVGKWRTTAQIHDALADIGYSVSRRTVERDLIKLASTFGIDLADNRGGWGTGYASIRGNCGGYEWRRTRPLEWVTARHLESVA